MVGSGLYTGNLTNPYLSLGDKCIYHSMIKRIGYLIKNDKILIILLTILIRNDKIMFIDDKYKYHYMKFDYFLKIHNEPLYFLIFYFYNNH